jgi:hypothetical protein
VCNRPRRVGEPKGPISFFLRADQGLVAIQLEGTADQACAQPRVHDRVPVGEALVVGPVQGRIWLHLLRERQYVRDRAA